MMSFIIINPIFYQLMKEESLHDVVMRTGGYPVIVAHRGGGCEFGPENTLYTCRKSAKHSNIRMLEVDIRLTKDYQMILMHDSSVDRTTNGTGPVSEYLLEELQELDAAINYPELRSTGIRVPTFEEFLEEFTHYDDLMFMFDFKDEESIERALPLIKSFPSLQNRYILGSVFEATNALLREIRLPGTPVVTDMKETLRILFDYHTPGLWEWHKFRQEDYGIFGYVLQSYSDLFLTDGLVMALHEKKMRVMACGPNLCKKKVLSHCMECGIDFIMLDCLPPELMCLEQESSTYTTHDDPDCICNKRIYY